MSHTRQTVISRYGQRVRLEVAPGADGALHAAIVPLSAGALAVSIVRECVETLLAQGVVEVATPALSEADAQGFERAGFDVRSRLHLLVHELVEIPVAAPPRPATHRSGGRDQARLLEVDRLAFDAAWHLDDSAFRAALTATPVVRVRVTGSRREPEGFAITGRAGRRGYLQRLAVDPSCHRHGHGRALVTDALRWCRRWRARRVVVNTQVGNERALALYTGLGFQRLTMGLVVMQLPLGSATATAGRLRRGPGSG